MNWQRPTSWSCETEDGLWYAEESSGKWTLHLMRGRGAGKKGEFATMEAAMAKAEGEQ